MPHLLRHAPAGTQPDAMVGVAWEAYVGAFPLVDPDKFITAPSYMLRRVVGGCIDDARKTDDLPRRVRNFEQALKRVCEDLINSLGRHPTDEEISQRLGMKPKIYQRYMHHLAVLPPVSLDSSPDGDPSNNLHSLASTDDPGPETAFEKKELAARLRHLLGFDPEHPPTTLDEVAHLKREQQMALLFHFLHMPMKDVAIMFGVTGGRVSQLLTEFRAKLRTQLEREGHIE